MSGLSIGDRAPAFDLPATDGGSYGVPDDPNPAVVATVVYWTCNHCPYALAWHERLIKVAEDYRDRGVVFLAVNSNDAQRYPRDSFDAMKARFEAEGGWPHPYLHDESQQLAREFGALKTPDLYVFDADLSLSYRGAPDADYDDPGQQASWLRAALDDVLAGRPVGTPETPPVGCSIKWR